MIRPVDVIRRKRDGKVLDEAMIRAMVTAIADHSASEGQVAAFAMAVFWRGLNSAERVALTSAMADSGARLSWSSSHSDSVRPQLDKHSTGGVGDKVSLILAPLLAACGASVPMISGRGLGHTGGTLDKLDSIPGYRSETDADGIRAALAAAHCAIVGQTADLVPADRRLYAVRDVTATVESLDLIVASILSKKLAAGIDALVLDVKTGSGAFMSTPEQATDLANALCRVGNGAGLPTRALLSDMNQVLGNSAGNALEVLEALAFLRSEWRDPRLLALVLALGAELLLVGGLAENRTAAEQKLLAALDSGSAAEQFAKMIVALGGPIDFCDAPQRHLVAAPMQLEVPAPAANENQFITAIDVRALGEVVVNLGGGRQRTDDAIDYRVGLSAVAGLGDTADRHRPLTVVHAASQDDAERAAAAVSAAYHFSTQPPKQPPLLHEFSNVTE